jgi:hypothetical protein
MFTISTTKMWTINPVAARKCEKSDTDDNGYGGRKKKGHSFIIRDVSLE